MIGAMGWRHDDVAKSLSHAPGALSPGDNRCDGTGMVPSIVITMPEVNKAILMPLGHGALEIGERRKLGHSLVKSTTTAPTSYPTPSNPRRAFLRGYSSSHR
ncbi:hypothetical protein ACNKHT_23825 [Shigella flexneri]